MDRPLTPPSIRALGIREVSRLVVIATVIAVMQVKGLCRWVIHPRRGLRRCASEGVVDAFFVLGPTFVKVGQLIASSPGLFSKVLADECLRCLDKVPSFPGAQARATIAQDLGSDPELLFASFDDIPLSSASVAQVHRATLRDGTDVVIKVQRRGIYNRMKIDLRIAWRIARMLEFLFAFFRTANAAAIIVDLHAATFAELDSHLEAKRQDSFRTNIGAFGDNEYVTAPQIFWEFCGARVICMERMHGVPLDRYDGNITAPDLVVRRAAKVWIEALLVHGLFHGDVHAGNVWVLDDGRVAFLDFGVMGQLDTDWQGLLQDLFHATVVDMDFTRLARSIRRLGIMKDTSASDAELALILHSVFAPMLAETLANFSLVDFIKSLVTMGKQLGASSPEELILVAKQLGYFERYAMTMAPDWALGTDPFVFRNVFPECASGACE